MTVEVTSMQSLTRGAAKGGRLASPRLAGLGWWPRVTVLLLVCPDALLVSVEVVSVRSSTVRASQPGQGRAALL
jgi:hypothetical protein